MAGEQGGRRTPVIAGIIGGVIGAVVAVVLVLVLVDPGGSSGSGHKAASTSTSTTVAPLKGAAGTMINLLEKGAKLEYHASYQVTSASAASQGATVTLQLWRQPPQVRQDTIVTTKGSTSDTAAFQIAAGVIQCDRSGTGTWSCQQATSSGVGLASPEQLAQTASSQLAGATVTQYPSTVDGRSSQCFKLVLQGQSTVVCVDADGVPDLLSTGGSQLKLVSLDRNLPSGIFTPPSAVS